ncbi:putative p30 dbc protein [Fasciola hepatica]|uniref:P30 dbc protein n=1 Tax=Fasciola hepatica TaxID=6192 RepID=A0A4E0RF82_FASHE|nr:putative p30 dbc protein [Fasciola hepatica]
MHPGASTATETSTHQLVGYVTKMFPTFGYINNEIFFQKKCVIGPMVEIGDNVATSAVYQPNMPIKWSAEKVWKVQDSRHSRSHERTDEEARAEKARSPRNSVDGESLRSHEKAYDDRSEKRKERYPRKRSPSPVSRRGHSRRSVETNAVKRRRLSPESGSIHTSGSTYSQAITRRLLNMSFLLNARELLIPDLRYRFPSVLAPVDLYKVVCHWQYSFPLLKPFYPEGTSVYQVRIVSVAFVLLELFIYLMPQFIDCAHTAYCNLRR